MNFVLHEVFSALTQRVVMCQGPRGVGDKELANAELLVKVDPKSVDNSSKHRRVNLGAKSTPP